MSDSGGTIRVELVSDGGVVHTWTVVEPPGSASAMLRKAGATLRVSWVPNPDEEETLVPRRSPFAAKTDEFPTQIEDEEPTAGDRTHELVGLDAPTQIENDPAQLDRLRARARTEARGRYRPPEPRDRPAPGALDEVLAPAARRALGEPVAPDDVDLDDDDLSLSPETEELDLDD